METTDKEYMKIKGWGIDADPENEPTYPMKNYSGDDHRRLNWERPELQNTEDIEILRSIERPSNSAVVGTSSPPSGISGAIRRFAYRFSESTYMHWLPLIVADRVNVIEGIVDDLAHGKVPNLFAEKGWNAEWKYNKKGMVTTIATVTVLSALAVILLSRKKNSESKVSY